MDWNQPSSNSRFTLRPVAVFSTLRISEAWGTEEFCQDDAGLAEAEVFRLQAGKDEVGLLWRDGRGEKAGEAEGIARGEIVGEDVDGAVCSLGEGFAQRDANALGTGR